MQPLSESVEASKSLIQEILSHPDEVSAFAVMAIGAMVTFAYHFPGSGRYSTMEVARLINQTINETSSTAGILFLLKLVEAGLYFINP